MFDLEKAIAAWRAFHSRHEAISPGDLDEIESHLRDEIDDLLREGIPPEEAFDRAVRHLGDYALLDTAYSTTHRARRMHQHGLAHELHWRLAMLKNYLTIALRNLRRQRGYAFINIAGLSLGLACCLLIFQYVAFEYSFDQYHTKADRLYRVTRESFQNGASQGDISWTGYGEAPAYAEEVPGIARFARLHAYFGGPVVSPLEAPEAAFNEERVYFADPAFLHMFTVPLTAGDSSTALTQPNTLLMSASAARKYFGDGEAVGQVLNVYGGYTDGGYEVVGVFEDVPANAHLQYDFLLPLEDILAVNQYSDPGSAWTNNNFFTYLELGEGVDAAEAEEQVTQSYMTRNKDGLAAANRTVDMTLEPLRHVHLNGTVNQPYAVVGNAKSVYFFAVIALITLIIALVNYVNLSTARALDRAKEVGVRKVVGAQRKQLMAQFLIESALVNLLALLLAIGLTMIATPFVSNLAGVDFSGALWQDGRFWTAFILLFASGAVLSGLYPAFVLSGFRPVSVLKGKAAASSSRFTLRRVLVIVQFAASIALLIGTIVVYMQLRHMRTMDLGLQTDQVLVVGVPAIRAEGVGQDAAIATLKQELGKLAGVDAVTVSAGVPGKGYNWYSNFYRATADPSTQQEAYAASVDHDFTEVYGLELVAGRPFTESTLRYGSTEDAPTAALLNETSVDRLGFPSAEAALGQDFYMGGALFRIQGVLKDFRWSSAHTPQEPIFLYPAPGWAISSRITSGNMASVVASVQNLYETLYPGNPFRYFFVDEEFDQLYQDDQRFATLFSVFAGLAMLIACLGLFGLSSFTAEQRTKEIGVRKVLGASVGSIVRLLSKDFLALVGIAFLVAAPLAWFAMRRWLEDFAYHIDLRPGVFLLAGGLALAVALLTVSYQALKAATADPVKSLRYE